MATEIERKFLVRGKAWQAAADGGRRIRQAYLSNNAKNSVRVRIIDAREVLAVRMYRSTREALDGFSKNAAVASVSPLLSAIGLPCSSVKRRASASWFSIIRSAQRRRIFAHAPAVIARQPGSARAAASIATAVSARPIRGTSASTRPSAGLVTAKRRP